MSWLTAPGTSARRQAPGSSAGRPARHGCTPPPESPAQWQDGGGNRRGFGAHCPRQCFPAPTPRRAGSGRQDRITRSLAVARRAGSAPRRGPPRAATRRGPDSRASSSHPAAEERTNISAAPASRIILAPHRLSFRCARRPISLPFPPNPHSPSRDSPFPLAHSHGQRAEGRQGGGAELLTARAPRGTLHHARAFFSCATDARRLVIPDRRAWAAGSRRA